MRILAGDVGATKTNLGLYEAESGKPLRRVAEVSLRNADFAHFDDVLRSWLDPTLTFAAAGFGIAGPIVAQEVKVTNLPWHISGAALARALGCPVVLLNDLEATAWATTQLVADDVRMLQPGKAVVANRCVIAAGTGLGQALLVREANGYRPLATEGGHVDFGPRDEEEVELARFLLHRFGRASYERILSGRGLGNLYDFVTQVLGVAASPVVRHRLHNGDPGAIIGAAAVAGECEACVAAVRRFVRIYGAQAGNLALATMALGGVYIAGGIAPRLGAAFDTNEFLGGFCAKQPFVELLQGIPVQLLLDERAPERGAAVAAYELVD